VFGKLAGVSRLAVILDFTRDNGLLFSDYLKHVGQWYRLQSLRYDWYLCL
jgi:hypothetical protein